MKGAAPALAPHLEAIFPRFLSCLKEFAFGSPFLRGFKLRGSTLDVFFGRLRRLGPPGKSSKVRRLASDLNLYVQPCAWPNRAKCPQPSSRTDDAAGCPVGDLACLLRGCMVSYQFTDGQSAMLFRIAVEISALFGNTLTVNQLWRNL